MNAERFLWLGALATGGIAMASLAMPAAAVSPASAEFHAPVGERVLTRTLRRRLGDGAEIVTTHRYAVEFVAEGQGYRVEGRQIEVSVEAPAKLAMLAELERQRRDDGMFPFHLDQQGLIIEDQRPHNAPAPLDPLTRTALHRVEAVLATGAMADDQRRQATTIAQALAGRFTAWPEDLFLPRTGTTAQTRHYILPDGTPGEVTVTTVAHSAGTWADRLERTLTTIAAGQTRTSSEIWTLTGPKG